MSETLCFNKVGTDWAPGVSTFFLHELNTITDVSLAGVITGAGSLGTGLGCQKHMHTRLIQFIRDMCRNKYKLSEHAGKRLH